MAIDLVCWKVKKVDIDMVFTGVKKTCSHRFVLQENRKGRHRSDFHGSKKRIDHTFNLMERQKGKHRSGLHGSKKNNWPYISLDGKSKR